MNTQTTPNPKCKGCNCYWKPTETDIKSSGLPYKTCKKCRNIPVDTNYRRNQVDTNYRSIPVDTNNSSIPVDTNNQKYEFYMQNPQAIYAREKYQNNKNVFRENIVCVCGTSMSRDNMKRHNKTSKHLAFISNK